MLITTQNKIIIGLLSAILVVVLGYVGQQTAEHNRKVEATAKYQANWDAYRDSVLYGTPENKKKVLAREEAGRNMIAKGSDMIRKFCQTAKVKTKNHFSSGSCTATWQQCQFKDNPIKCASIYYDYPEIK